MKHPGAYVTAWGIEAVAGVAARLPRAQPSAHGVERIRNVSYRETGSKWHTCDIYRPVGVEGPLPVVLYFHGGGFFSLSKDTHWLMGLIFARRGFLVMNFSYRLAPRNPYPAALEDACEAYAWGVEQASRWGGDVSKLVLAGESAGANLVVALTAASSMQRPEPFAQKVRATGVHPSVVVPACGVFDVSGAKDLTEGRSHFIRMRLIEVEEYLLGGVERTEAGGVELADPLCLLESQPELIRELPPCFLPVGGHDPLVRDSQRLERVWKELGGRAQMKSYPGEGHAFHALIWREPARECWRDTLSFVADTLEFELL
ncbi:MAG: alpha/beta hydrolase [Myxococcota bacterium]|nr:alpha/beta hydrolase [Myxococcota bacterium]